MNRSLVTVVLLLAIILQGLTVATADVFPEEQSAAVEHCSGHADRDTGDPCCGESDMTLACAATCIAAAPVPAGPVIVISFVAGADITAFAWAWAPGPAYSPLNPPPIS
jgi:hypothetical protein